MSSRRRSVTGVALLAQPERVEASLWRRLRASDHSHLRESLFDRYRRFAGSLARRYARRNRLASDVLEDLEQFAYRGLLEAIDRFDPRRGIPFVAFATSRIAGCIVDGLGDLDEFGAQLRFRRRVERERLTSLSAAEGEAKSAMEQLADVVAELALGLMLDAEDRSSVSAVTGHVDNGFDNLAWRETQALLRARVDALPEPERSVIRHHYHNDLLFAQIASMLGLSRGRVSQIHKAALVKLRKSMRFLR